MLSTPPAPLRTPITMRIRTRDLEQIDRLAAQRDLSRTEYLTLAGLGQLDQPGDLELRDEVADLRERIARLEELAFSG